MLRQLKSRKDTRRILLFFGVNSEADLFYLEDLQALRGDLPGLELRVAIATGGAVPGARKGFVTDLLSPGILQGSDVYLCGPPPMVESGMAAAATHAAAATFTEQFTPS